MTTSSTRTRKTAAKPKTRRTTTSRRSAEHPLIIYTSQSVDGTSFGFDPESQRRVREAFPDVRVSTEHVYIAHDTKELISESIQRFEKQIIALLTGVTADQIAEKFSVSFRDPWSERDIVKRSALPKVA